ncbi:MAG TPA: M3 family metallopeptidase [bacterium]
MTLLDDLNQRYLTLHTAKEDAFWAAKMGLKGGDEHVLEKNEIRLKEFTTDGSWIPKLRQALGQPGLGEQERVGLEGWLHFFEVNAMESKEALAVMSKIVGMEADLANARTRMKLGYKDPQTGALVPSSSVKLRLMVMTNPEEGIRKAAWEGLRSIEGYVLENGFIEIVKERNRLGRLMGYRDFYDWKVKMFEGFSIEELFRVLDELEVNTREVGRASVEAVAKAKGPQAIEPWNFEFATAGDLSAELDPYLRFGSALLNWGRSFAKMGIRYHGAKLTLDLVDRKGKYENGFMHGPVPAFINREEFLPARINFTANAVPGQVGSGKRALETLFHEGGHAAHFSNIEMPAPCYSQEFAPTSIAFAETQSMFLDSVVGDPDWLTRYAKNEAGQPMPAELIKRSLKERHTFLAHQLRKLMIVPYFERALYGMSDSELTPKNILEAGRRIEAQMVHQPSDARPILSVPHLLASDSSAYYHAYVLAQMAVYQTRAFFLERDGRITDNPRVGSALADIYWKPGNSKTFFRYIEELTGKPFSAKATVDLVNKPLEVMLAETDVIIEKEKILPDDQGPVELGAKIRMIHGDELIASTEDDTFEQMAAEYERWLHTQEQ